MTVLAYGVAAWLFVVGLYGVVTSRHMVHLIVCVTIVQASTYVLLLAIGYRTGATAPVFKDVATSTAVVDPIAQTLVSTDVVVEATLVALLLALTVQAQKRFGTVDPDGLAALRD